MAGVMPCGTLLDDTQQKAAIFWSLPTNQMDEWHQKGVKVWREEAISFWPAFEPFVNQIKDIEQLTIAKYSHGTLLKPWENGIVFIGDAAHRASPQLGQGANMALLDGLALVSAMDVVEGEAAFKLYAKSRRWHCLIYQLMSWIFTPQYQSNSRMLPMLRDKLLFPLSQIPPVPTVLTRLVCGDMINPIAEIYRDGPWQ